MVDAHELGPDVERTVELALVVHLDQGIEGELARQAEKARELVVGQRRHDEQDGVGPHEPGVADVGRRHREVLAQDGEATGRARAASRSAGVPPKNASSVSTETQVGTTRLVVAGQLGGVELGVEVTFGR